MAKCRLHADVSYFLCFTRKRDVCVSFPPEAKEIGDVCTQARLNAATTAKLACEQASRSRITQTVGASASRRPINLLRSSKPGACSQATAKQSLLVPKRNAVGPGLFRLATRESCSANSKSLLFVRQLIVHTTYF